MNCNPLTFLRANKRSGRLRRAMPVAIRETHIVAVTGGYQLHAKLKGSSDQWVLTTPGGLADTTSDIFVMRQFAALVLGRPNKPTAR